MLVSAYDRFRSTISRNSYGKPSRFRQGLGNTVEALKTVSTHPVASVTTMDLMLTTLSLLAWTFMRNLDVGDLMDNSILSYFNNNKEKSPLAENAQAEKVIDASDSVPKIEDAPEEPEVKTPRRRGRPRKSSITRTPAGTSAVRRSTRRRTRNASVESEEDDVGADATYMPSAETQRAWEHTEVDKAGVQTEEDLLEGGESTALALLIALFGGLGQLAASVLGAEITGGSL